MGTGQDRAQLGFIEAVTNHIAPLLAARGFTQVEATDNLVRFESPRVIIRIIHEPYSYELRAGIAPVSASGREYCLSEILRSIPAVEPKYRGSYQTSDREGVRASVRVIAEILLKYCEDILAGESRAFQLVSEAAGEFQDHYARQVSQAPIRQAAEEAWRQGEYRTVHEL